MARLGKRGRPAVGFLLAASVTAITACSSSSDGDADSDAATTTDSAAGGDTGSALDGAGSDTNGKPDGIPATDTATGDTSATDAGSDGGTTTLANPAPGSKLFVGSNFWNIDWEGSADFFASGTDFATTTNPWRPELLTDLAPYHVLRFMDWNQTNMSSNPQAVWTTRKLKTEAQGEPVAFEWQIDLCNRTKKDYWLNVPHEASADYWSKLAKLVHDQLDPSLRVYLEWSNEVWNGGFPAHDFAAGKATALGLPGSDNTGAYYVYASVRLYEAFETEFGKGSPRLVKVLAGQAAWTGPCEAHMTALKDATINPKGTMPDVYAIAPYFSGNSLSALKTSVPTMGDWVKAHVTCVKSAGLPIISYEGGQDSFGAGAGCVALQKDPAMHDLYGSFLDTLATAGMKGPFVQYTHTGSCWGLKEKTSDPATSAPKYQGVVDWIAAH